LINHSKEGYGGLILDKQEEKEEGAVVVAGGGGGRAGRGRD